MQSMSPLVRIGPMKLQNLDNALTILFQSISVPLNLGPTILTPYLVISLSRPDRLPFCVGCTSSHRRHVSYNLGDPDACQAYNIPNIVS